MVGGLMMTGARTALLAATGVLLVGGASAQAADLGGNCCADLEERIAELEATTARKGNRKVSLTISGWVNEAAFFWDDGVEQNTYVGTNSLEQDRVKLSGEAKIVDGWSAGYVIEMGINGAGSSGFSQTNTNSLNNVVVRKSAWYLKSKDLGKVSVGQDATATYHLLDDADGANTRNYSDAEAAGVAIGAFVTRTNGKLNTGVTWNSVMGGFNNVTPGQDGRRNVVRYDSPTIANFSASAAWGEDDIWDMSLTYKADAGDFKLLGRVGYGEGTDPKVGNQGACAAIGGVTKGDCSWWGAAGTIMHAPTGLYVYGGYGSTQIDLLATAPAGTDDESTTWFVQGGIEKKWLPLGKTTIFGEYRHDDVGATAAAKSADLDFYAGGVVQNIENAAMDLYVIYRHSEGEAILTGKTATTSFDDFDMVITGARIQF